MRSRNIRVHMAHMPGQCAAAQTPDGKFLFTSGVDATLRPHDICGTATSGAPAWWRADSPQEPDLPDLSASDLHEKPVTALSITPNGTNLASASTDGFVRIFTLPSSSQSAAPSVEFEQACARFAGPVRALDFSPTGAFLAAAGEEPGLLKVIMTAQPTSVNVLRAPENSPANDAIVALAFDPIGDYIITIAERGVAAVWDVDKCVLVQTIDLNGRKAACVTWAPDTNSMIFGTDRGAVAVARDTWMLDYLLEDVADGDDDDDDDIFSTSAGKNEICAIAWSPNGRYVLTARKDCNISLWDIHRKRVLGMWKAEHQVQTVNWHCKTNAFILVDNIGQWGIVSDVVPSHMPSPQTDSPLIELPTIPDDAKPTSADKAGADEDEDETVIKRSKGAKLKKQKMLERKRKAKEDKDKKTKGKSKNASDAEPEDDQQLENGFKFNASDVEADDEDEGENDNAMSLGSQDTDDESGSDEEVPGELAGLENAGVRLPKLKRKPRSEGKRGGGHGMHSVALVPTPFMPASTPVSEKTSKKARILTWNLVGAVLSFDESTHDVVEIEFAEATKRNIGIKDHFGYTLGCLSETGVFLGAVKTKDHGAVVSFRPFSAWAQNAEWTQFMMLEEDISVIALGKRFAAVATTPNNLIRLFSLSGLQTTVYGVPGTVVTVAAAGDMLVVVFCEEGSSSLRCELLAISSVGEVEKILYAGGLMLSADSQLEWLGFTNDTFELCSYDSKGWLWMMCDARSTKRWVPQVQNAAKSAECDWFWAASVTSKQFIGAPCLSNERHPPAKPRPSLRSIALSAPVIGRVSKNGKATVTERLGRTTLSLQRAVAMKLEADEMYGSDDEEVEKAEEAVSRIELEADKCILSLMEDACKREQNMRALDLATRLHCKISFKYAIELAKHFKRTALASRVEHVAAQKIAVIEDDVQARLERPDHTTVGTSPVSWQNVEGRRVGATIATKANGAPKATNGSTDVRMESSDEEGEAKETRKQSAIPIAMLVTDDEEEEEEERVNRKDDTANSNGAKKADARGKKRRAPASTLQSEDSAKAGKGSRAKGTKTTSTITTSAKKAKVEMKAEQGKTRSAASPANSRFTASFKNRFYKK